MEIKIFGKVISFTNVPKNQEKQEIVEENVVKQEEKPCRNRIIYDVNVRTIQVITCDGNVYNGFNISSDVIDTLKDADDYSIVRILTPKEEVKVEEETIEEQEEKVVVNYLDIFTKEAGDFEVVDGKVYLRGIKSISVPSAIVAAFIDMLNKGERMSVAYSSLLMFTYKLLANPIEDSRNTLLNFVRQNKVQLTNSGNLVLYRRIVNKESGDKELTRFISESYVKIKKAKKSPKNYTIYSRLGDYQLCSNDREPVEDNPFWDEIGNLMELYSNLSTIQGNLFTDAHTGTYDIKVGEVYRIREEDIQLNHYGSCGGLLHCAVRSFDYSGFGEQEVMVLVSPMNTARTDTGYSEKIGVTEMFICCTLDNSQEIKEDELVDFDDFYENHTIEHLEEAIKNKSVAPVSIAEEVSELSLKEVVNVLEVLKNRVVTV